MLKHLVRARGALGAALGAFEVAAPGKIVAADRLDGDPTAVVRVAGAHKLASGAVLLAHRDARIGLSMALAGSVYDALALRAKHASGAAYARLAAVAAIDALLLGFALREARA